MAANLDAIPPELLCTLFDDLEDDKVDEDPRDRLRTFRSLALTSRRLNVVVTPYLYSEFLAPGNGKVLERFVQTLCEKPDLAKHVQHVHLIPVRVKQPQSITWDIQPFTAASAHLRELPVYDAITLALGGGCYTALALSLLTLTTKMKRLAICLRPVAEDEQLAELIADRMSGYDPSVIQFCECDPDVVRCLEAIFSSEALRDKYRRLTQISVTGNGRIGLASYSPSCAYPR